MLFSPLEQFQQFVVIPFKITSFLNFSILNSTLTQLWILFIFFLFTFVIYGFYTKWYPTKKQYLLENFFSFIKNIVISNIGFNYLYFFPFIFFLFAFIFLCNLFGMVPFTFTLTSHIIITFMLSLTCFFGLTFLGCKKHGLHFFSLFLPEGVPLFISPFLIIIELISYFARVFSLGIRLFANMMAGHTLMKILAGFGWSMWSVGGLWIIFGFIPVIIIFLVTGLEIAISFLQAYVFIILVCIYINDCIHLH
jgi:ATP synthase subunit 6